MLPDVDRQQRDQVRALIAQPILVGRSPVLEGLRSLVVGEPAPAAALDRRRIRIKMSNESVDAAERFNYSLVQGRISSRQLAAIAVDG